MKGRREEAVHFYLGHPQDSTGVSGQQRMGLLLASGTLAHVRLCSETPRCLLQQATCTEVTIHLLLHEAAVVHIKIKT